MVEKLLEPVLAALPAPSARLPSLALLFAFLFFSIFALASLLFQPSMVE